MDSVNMIIKLLYSIELSIPLFQVLLLLSASTVLLLFGKIKHALLVSYVFTLYWGYVFNIERLVSSLHGKINILVYLVYFGFGFTIMVLALIGLLTPS